MSAFSNNISATLHRPVRSSSLKTHHGKLKAPRGMTLIEVLFGIAIIMIAFTGFFALFQVSIDIVSASKSRAGAIALANERMEYIRSLSYAAVGTVNGIPSGSIPQSESVSLNGTTYTRRTFVQYVDDPADGTGSSDSNTITADYKRAKVELSWSIRGIIRTYSLVSSIVPKGIESVTGGGTLSIQVFNALATPVSSASVRIYKSGSPATDVTTYTNASGIVLFPGTPTGSGYQITVTKAGFSTAKTYSVDAVNTNPSPRDLSISTNQTTSASFAIDALAALVVRTWKPIEVGSWSDTFTNASDVAEMASTTVSGGALTLTATSGYAFSTTTAPAYLSSWTSAAWTSSIPSGASVNYQLYTVQNGVRTLVPNSDLPGNGSGFTTSPVSLATLSTTTYQSLILSANLAKGSATTFPSVLDWRIDYQKGPTPLPSIPFSIKGVKTIGTGAGGASLYKVSQTLSTDAAASYATTTLEWDSYTLSVDPTATGYDISESCTPQPISVAPASSVGSDLYLVPKSTNSLLVAARHATSSALIPGVQIRLYKTGVSLYATTTSCGQVFFSGLAAGTGSGTYSITATKSGYTTVNVSGVTVSGPSKTSVAIQ